MNQRIVNKFNTVAVNAYKALGSVLLALILGGLVSYLGVQVFFFVNHSWLTPTVVSPTDPEILQLNAQLAQQAASRDKLLAERRELEARMEQAERLLGSEKDFQERFRVALGSERTARAKAARSVSSGRSPTRPMPSAPVPAAEVVRGESAPVTPTARASTSETPPTTASALVCAANRAMRCSIRVCSRRPLAAAACPTWAAWASNALYPIGRQ